MQLTKAYYKSMQYHWDNPPPPFNQDFNPKAKQRYMDVTTSMEADGFYKNHTREECRIEWRHRYDNT